MGQLDLFRDAPRHYLEAVRLLGALDLTGCRRELRAHRRLLPAAEPDPRGLEAAASWLEGRLPAEGLGVPEYGALSLLVCRELVEGRALAFRGLGGETRRGAARNLAHRALTRARAAGLDDHSPLAGSLPWAVFRLFAGRPKAAQGPLAAVALGEEGGAAAWLALGDALWEQGFGEDALAAYREGCGLDPGLTVWTPASTELGALRESFAGDPLFAGPWWAVGAYVEGSFPRYRLAEPPLLAARWRRFAAARDGRAAAPVVFFAGLFLSEHGSLLPNDSLEVVRRTLRDIHPAAFDAHRDGLAERGPLESRRAPGGLP